MEAEDIMAMMSGMMENCLTTQSFQPVLSGKSKPKIRDFPIDNESVLHFNILEQLSRLSL